MKKRYGILLLVLIAVIIVAVILSYEKILPRKEIEKIQPIKESKTLKIGFVGDLSNENLGKAALLGAEIAVEEINSKAELIGNKYELIVYDTKNQTELIESYFNKLSNEDKVLAIISTHPDNAEIAEKLKVPTILIGQDKLKAERGNNFYWGIELTYITADSVFHAIRKFKSETSISSSVMVVDDTQFIDRFERFNSAMKNILPLFNISLLGYFTLDEDIAGLVSKIKDLKPDVVILSVNFDNAINFLKEAKNQDLSSKIFLRHPKVSISELQAQYQNLPEIIYMPLYITSIDRSILTPDSEFTPFMVFDKKIAERSGGGEITAVHLNAYDAINLLNTTLQRGNILNTPENLQKNREEVVKALWATRGYTTLRGDLFADGKTGFLRRTYNRIIVLDKGKISALSDGPISPFTKT